MVKLDTFHEYVTPRKRSKLAPLCMILSFQASLWGFPSASVVEGTVNGVSVQILMDTGFSKSYINHRLLKGLKLSLEREPSAITTASTSHSVQVKGAILINLKVFNKNYPKFKLGVMEELCTEVILGLDFMKLNSKSNLKCMDLKKLYPLIAL